MKKHTFFEYSVIRIATVLFFFIAFAVNGQTTYYVDDDTGDDSRTLVQAQNPATPWLTIQHAITSVAGGDTIVVAPGTYPEQIVINKSITLRGATYLINKNGYPVPPNYAWDDNVESIIDCPPTVQNLISSQNVSGYTIEGFVIQALHRDNNNQNNLIRISTVSAHLDNIILRNNVIGPNTNIVDQDGTKGRMNLFIYLSHQDFGLTNSLLKGNKIFDSKGDGNNVFIFGSYEAMPTSISAPMDGTLIDDNELSGSHRSGIEIAGGVEGLVISNNDIFNNSGYITDPPEKLTFGNGIIIIRSNSDLVSGSNAHGTKNIVIRGNDIYNNQKNGIYLGPIDSALTIVDNRIANNGWDAIRIDLEEHYFDGNPNWNPVYDKMYDVVSAFNNHYGNDSSGVKVVGIPTNGFVLEGLYNYWGAKDGPGIQGPGSGNGVSDFVDFAPWIDDEIQHYLQLKSNVTTGVGHLGGEVITTITSVPNDDNFLDIYQTGLFTDLPEVTEDFVTNLTGCIFRFKLLWGIVETGSVTADLVFDYSNQPGIADPSDIIILRRSSVLFPAWEYVPETSRDDANRTITLAGVSSFGEYVLGFKGKFWTAGNLSNDWNDPFNWFSVGVPTNFDNIIIPGGLPFYPEVNNGFLARAKNVYVEPAAHLTIPINNGLTIHGDLLNNGTITVLSDNTGQAGTFINNGMLAGNGTFSFNRDMTGTGAHGDPEGWHYISSPVDGMSCHHIFDYWINAWDETQNSWYNYSVGAVPCIAGPDHPFETFTGYSLKRDLNYMCGAVNPATGNVIEFTGLVTDVHSGNYSVNVTGTGFSGGGALDNWNLLGNPYPASIDYEYWENTAGGIPPQVDDAVYFWDDAAMVYRSWVGGAGFTQYIPPAQGFYMHVNTVGTWPVSIDNSVRTHAGSGQYFKSGLENLLVLQASGNGYSDLTYIRFSEASTPAFDGKYDAYKLLSTVDFVPQIYTYAAEDKVSINTMPATQQVLLAFEAGRSGYYSIDAADNSGFDFVVLEDKADGSFTDLTGSPYKFFHVTGDDPGRFLIHFGNVAGDNQSENISVFGGSGNIYINVLSDGQAEATIHNVMGQQTGSASLISGLNQIPVNTRNSFYVVRIKSGSGIKSFVVFVK